MDKLTAFTVFAEVAERGSFTLAGKHLGLSRSMVGRYITDLETWLDTRLLQRSTRKLTLTSAGEECLVRARELLDLSYILKEKVGGQSTLPGGNLRVTCAISFGNMILVPLIKEFLELNPGVSIEIALTDRATNLVQEGIDLAITMTDQLNEGLIAHPISECSSVVAASPEYLRQHNKISSITDLANHNCLRHAYYGLNGWSFDVDGVTSLVRITGNLVVNDALALGYATVSGLGVALLPYYVAKPHIESGALQLVCQENAAKPINVYGVYKSRSYIPATLKQLLAFLKERLHEGI